MPQVDEAHERVGLRHQPEDEKRKDPQRQSRPESNPLLRGDDQGKGYDSRRDDQFTVTPEQKAWTSEGLMNGNCSEGHVTPS